MLSPITDQATAKDGCTLNYRIHPQPEKPKLVLVHSLGLDLTFWDQLISELGQDVEILTYDCRGHGKSERRPADYSIKLFADDLAAVLDHCQWPSAVVAGCSMGGCVAQGFAAAYPSRTQALGCIDTTAWYGPTAVADWAQRAATAAEKGFPGMLPFQVTRWFSDQFRESNPVRVAEISRVFADNDAACFKGACTLLGNMDLRSALPSFLMPVAVVVGEEDFATPVSMAQAIHEAVPGSTLTVLTDGRHLTPVELPRSVGKVLMDLIQRARDASYSHDSSSYRASLTD